MHKFLLSLLFVGTFAQAQPLILDVGARIVMTGVFPAGGGQPVAGVFVMPSVNPHECLYAGILYTSTSNMKEALAVALTAKAANAPVRLDYTKMADTSCIGASIYMK